MVNLSVERLLSEIYDAVPLENGWPAALRTVIRAIDGDSGCVCWKPLATSPLAEIASVGLDVPDYLNRYRHEVERLSVPFYNLFRAAPTGELAAIGKQAFDRDYQRSTFFNEWAKPLGFGDVAGCHLVRERSLYGWFNVRRDYQKGPFPENKLTLGRTLMPHLARALTLWARLQSVRVIGDSLAAALDLLTCSVIIVDAEGMLLHANRVAEHLLSRSGPLFGLRGRIGCRPHELNKALLKAIHDATSPAAMLEPGICRGIAVPTEEGTTLAIHVVPIGSANNWGDVRVSSAAAALFIANDNSTASPPLDAFAARYGLTRMEARVLAEVLTGEGLRRVSERLEIGATTARSHLQKVFLKTGTSKQAELVRLFFAQTVPISQFRVR